jgi:hypothetical protein
MRKFIKNWIRDFIETDQKKLMNIFKKFILDNKESIGYVDGKDGDEFCPDMEDVCVISLKGVLDGDVVEMKRFITLSTNAMFGSPYEEEHLLIIRVNGKVINFDVDYEKLGMFLDITQTKVDTDRFLNPPKPGMDGDPLFQKWKKAGMPKTLDNL